MSIHTCVYVHPTRARVWHAQAQIRERLEAATAADVIAQSQARMREKAVAAARQASCATANHTHSLMMAC